MRVMLGAVFLTLPLMAEAATVVPTSYTYITQPNIDRVYGYADDTGVQLTDGVRSTAHWSTEEPGGPNVGWFGLDPTIRFDFADVLSFTSVVMTIQDTGGGAGVGIAQGIDINGLSFGIVSQSAGKAIDLSFDLGPLAATDSLLITVDAGYQWTFISEFSFEAEATTVPLPAGLPLLLAGLGSLAILRRRRG